MAAITSAPKWIMGYRNPFVRRFADPTPSARPAPAAQPKTHPFGVERFGLEWVTEFVLAIAKPSAAKKVAVVNTATAMARRRNMAGVNIGAFPSAHARFGHEGS